MKKAFTLIEVLLVVTIAATMFGTGVIALNSAKTQAMEAKNSAMAVAIETAKMRYLLMNEDKEWPPDEARRWDAMLPFLFITQNGLRFTPAQPVDMANWPIDLVIGSVTETTTVRTAKDIESATILDYSQESERVSESSEPTAVEPHVAVETPLPIQQMDNEIETDGSFPKWK